MKLTDLYQNNVNQFTNHIVVDLIIIIIITAISVFLLMLLAENKNKKELRNENYFDQFMNYEIIILSILFIVHFLFSFLSIMTFTLDSTVSSLGLIFLAIIYGIYLTFLMKRTDNFVKRKLYFLESLHFNSIFRLFIHFSIVPLLITTIIAVIN
jgi:uncharacterized membrane protein YbjE (DUF340 family)